MRKKENPQFIWKVNKLKCRDTHSQPIITTALTDTMYATITIEIIHSSSENPDCDYILK